MGLLKKDNDVVISLDTVIVKKKEIDDTDIDGEKVMMNIDKGEYFMINAVGTDIWNSLDEPIEIQCIINKLLTQYEIDNKTCESEVISFIEQLKGAELIQIKSPKKVSN